MISPMLAIVFVGPAGCGKTSLTYAFGRYLEREFGYRILYINIDPGVKKLPYKPHFDIRKYFTVEELMEREGLGPNGALLRAMDLLLQHSKELIDFVESSEGDFALVDTPGQMEPFLFRDAGPEILAKLKEAVQDVVTVLVLDPSIASKASGLALVALLTIVIQLRLETKAVTVINKADLVKDPTIYEIVEDPEALRKELEKEQGVITDLADGVIELIKNLKAPIRPVPVSAKRNEGLDQLYDLIHEAFCTCGDMT